MAKKELKARFYRLTASVDDAQVTFPSVDWAKVLRGQADLSHQERVVNLGDLDLLIDPRATGARHLAVHRLRDADEYVSRIGADGRITEVMGVDDEGNRYADTSCIVFKQDSAIFGICQANQSAPRANRVAEWLTRLNPAGIHGEVVYHAVPLRLDPRVNALAAADGATKLTFRVPVAQLRPMGISLGEDSQDLARDLPNAMATVEISVGRRRPMPTEGRGLLAFVRNQLISQITGDDQARARIYNEVESKPARGGARKGRTRLQRQMVDLIHQEIAHVFKLSVANDEVRIDATLNAVELGLSLKAGDLAKALEGSDDG